MPGTGEVEHDENCDLSPRNYGYGYLWWLNKIDRHEVAIAEGYGCQMIYVIPSLDIVVVVTTNTADDETPDGGPPAIDVMEFIRAYVIKPND